MNQILYIKQDDENHSQKRKKKSLNRFLKLQFIFSFIFASLAIFFYFFFQNKSNENEKISKKLIAQYNIASLYQSNELNTSSDNITPLENKQFQVQSQNQFQVIGLIEIPKIHLTYPILGSLSDELLKISPCKFYGPNPNEIGNLCIAGHNYDNYQFFSKLNQLKENDTISIYDLKKEKIDYFIYQSYEISSDDLSCTNQETNGFREITLVTCNNFSGKRLIVKAKEKVV